MLSRVKKLSGFTLIEMLVVLVIIAIVTAVALMAFGDFGRSRQFKMNVEHLSRVFPAARQHAILQPAILGMHLTRRGVAFYQFKSDIKRGVDSWVPLSNDFLSQPDLFKPGVSLTVIKAKHTDLLASKNTDKSDSAAADNSVSPTKKKFH